MSRYLLDSDITIHVMRGRAPVVTARLKRQRAGSVGISAITLAELLHGVEGSAIPEDNRRLLARFLADLPVHPFDEIAAGFYGRVKADLRRKGLPIGPLDTLIASHALALECTMVTANTREFGRVPGLNVEDWTHGVNP